MRVKEVISTRQLHGHVGSHSDCVRVTLSDIYTFHLENKQEEQGTLGTQRNSIWEYLLSFVGQRGNGGPRSVSISYSPNAI